MKWIDAENMLKQELQVIYDVGEAAAVADVVMEKVTGTNWSGRMSRQTTELSQTQEYNVNEYLKQLLKHMPVQYVLNEAPFYGLQLYVDKDVLIPRPETEELVDIVVKDLRSSHPHLFHKADNEADKTEKLKILDVATGSGCIALALKKAIPLAEVWGCDISDAALNVARRNGSELDIRVDFVGLDFLDAAQRKQLPTVDVIVSNPPYIPLKEKENMQSNVLEHEPHEALFVPDDDAFKFYKALIEFAKKRLHAGGKLYAEIHKGAGKELIELFQQHHLNVEIKKDMHGNERFLLLSK